MEQCVEEQKALPSIRQRLDGLGESKRNRKGVEKGKSTQQEETQPKKEEVSAEDLLETEGGNPIIYDDAQEEEKVEEDLRNEEEQVKQEQDLEGEEVQTPAPSKDELEEEEMEWYQVVSTD